ncbi:MAG: DUF1761 domain-containing protein [Paracoccus sp. (in: a-proteobacteria)]|nr:DUF1761 domain-containing protein [Paracoccus sp. (in: a-proteobacteria)]
MILIIILAAATLAWVAGSLWYMSLARPWTRVSGIKVDNTGAPENKSPLPYLMSGLCLFVVASLMHYIFARAGIDTLGAGLLHGAMIGAGFVVPWTVLHNTYVQRPFLLTLIDGGYAVLACALMGTVLGAL